MNITPFKYILIAVILIGLACPVRAQDSQIQVLEERVRILEEYIRKIEPNLNEFSRSLIDNLDLHLKGSTGKVITLSAISKKFSKIETNTGSFLMAINKMEKIREGYRMYLHVGNPHAASFGDVVLRLRWGKKWDESYVKPTYDEWRQSLHVGEYVYRGKLLSGQWSEIIVDLTPARPEMIEYIECEMEVGTVELEKVKGDG